MFLAWGRALYRLFSADTETGLHQIVSPSVKVSSGHLSRPGGQNSAVSYVKFTKKQYSYQIQACYMKHEWQWVKSVEYLLPYTVLNILQFISFIKSFTQTYYSLKSILLRYDYHVIFFIIILKNMEEDILNYYYHCPVSWDSLCMSILC